MDENKNIEVGEYSSIFNDILHTDIPIVKIYRSKGLIAHLIKSKHFNCLKHIDDIPEIISDPDYIGINNNENEKSLELIKIYEKNILIGIKLDGGSNYLYISTMHDVQQQKIERRLHSGRLKIFPTKSTDNIDK